MEIPDFQRTHGLAVRKNTNISEGQGVLLTFLVKAETQKM
jgi:hypothetical protein